MPQLPSSRRREVAATRPTLVLTLAALLVLLGGCRPGSRPLPSTPLGTPAPAARACEIVDADVSLDEWHLAAAQSRLDDYLALMSSDARFLGTDASERWSKAELRRYAEEPFAEGRGWEMRATRRDVFSHEGAGGVNTGELVWFDEDLETKNLGPARGSGALRCRADGRFEIVHYVLSITVPNDAFPAVRALLSGA